MARSGKSASPTGKAGRIDALMSKVLAKGAQAFLVTEMTSIRYLTGFTGSSGMLFITPDKRVLASDFRYREQALEEVGEAAKVVISQRGLKSTARRLASSLRVSKLGFESTLPFSFYDFLKGGVAQMVPFQDAVLKLRAVKDADELGHIREAVRRAEEAFRQVKPRIKAGVTERSIALRLFS